MTQKLSQKEAVFSAVTSVLGENGVSVSDSSDVGSLLTKEHRSQVNNILFASFRAGTIELDRTFSDVELRAYVSGLQSNWLRKDSRLNGGAKYAPKNPGSRAGSSDPSLKAMRALRKTLSSESDISEVEAAIATRVSELAAAKSSKVSINVESLPESLRGLVK
jgi:hypothetical protein